MTQHSTLTQERWSSFSSSQQILMIANEMNRAKKLFSLPDKGGLTLCGGVIWRQKNICRSLKTVKWGNRISAGI